MNKTQRFGAGGGAGDKFKMDRIQLFVTGDFISIDLRGCQMPTPRPRPHIPVLYREGGFTPPELYDAIEAADAWMYSRNIGVLSRCVSFTLGEWEKEISPRGEVMERSRVYGEIEEFTEFLLCGNQNLRRVRPNRRRLPPRHRAPPSMAYRCRFLPPTEPARPRHRRSGAVHQRAVDFHTNSPQVHGGRLLGVEDPPSRRLGSPRVELKTQVRVLVV